jgi:hypothetical protein
MREYVFEGGPLDGERRVTDGAHIVRVPVPLPRGMEVFDTGLTYSVWEYERVGQVYRYETLVPDAVAEMQVTAEAFRDPHVRRYAREMLRRNLERLAAPKQVDRIVWVLARDEHRSMFSLAAVVGGRRAERAAHLREDRRSGLPS